MENGKEKAPVDALRNSVMDVLLVEDDSGDVELAEEAIRRGGVKFRLTVAEDGVQALRYLRREGEFSSATRPDLVILDLNLPRRNGREVLGDIRADPALRDLPVVLLSTSAVQEDLMAEFGLSRESCFTKPFRFDEFVEVMRAIERRFRSQPT